MVIASLQMGVAPLPVEMAQIKGWAQLCNTCETRVYQVSKDILCYADPEFLRLVAYHEVCHVAMGHDGTFMILKGGFRAEQEAIDCVLVRARVTIDHHDTVDFLAAVWYEDEGRACR